MRCQSRSSVRHDRWTRALRAILTGYRPTRSTPHKRQHLISCIELIAMVFSTPRYRGGTLRAQASSALMANRSPIIMPPMMASTHPRKSINRLRRNRIRSKSTGESRIKHLYRQIAISLTVLVAHIKRSSRVRNPLIAYDPALMISINHRHPTRIIKTFSPDDLFALPLIRSNNTWATSSTTNRTRIRIIRLIAEYYRQPTLCIKVIIPQHRQIAVRTVLVSSSNRTVTRTNQVDY